MKTKIVYAFLGVLTFVINFIIYNYSFNLQATPYLHEERRVDSAILMFKVTVPAYLISAFVVTLIFYFVAKKANRNQPKE